MTDDHNVPPKRLALLIASFDAANDVRILKQASSLASDARRPQIFHFPGRRETIRSEESANGGSPDMQFVTVPWRAARNSWVAGGATLALGVLVSLIAIYRLGGPTAGALAVIVSAVIFTAILWISGILRKLARNNIQTRQLLNQLWQAINHRAKTRKLAAAIAAIDQPFTLHAHEPGALAMAAGIAANAKAPLIYDAHELYEDMAGSTPGAGAGVARIHARFLPAANRVITVSESIGKYYAENFQLRDKAIIVANALNPQKLPPYDGRLHEAAGLERDARIILYHGGFTRERGLEELIEAMDQAPDWRLVLMGAGPLEPRLRQIAGKLEPARAPVAFIPPAPNAELLQWVQGAAIGAIPYANSCLNHSFCAPNKLWELPAAGVPVLARELDNIGAIIRTSQIGWTFQAAGGASAIAAALSAIDAAGLQNARAACARFIDKDNWRLYERRLLALYRELD